MPELVEGSKLAMPYHLNDIRAQMPLFLRSCCLIGQPLRPKFPKFIWAMTIIKIRCVSYAATAQYGLNLSPENAKLIMPRALKPLIYRRTNENKSEVFTPTWIVKKQNDAVDAITSQ
jgi:hypothetical protein